MARFIRFAVSLLSLYIFQQGASAAIELKILNNCNDMQELSTALKSGDYSRSCREPHDNLEEELYKKAGGPRSELCFLEQNPVSGLEGFSCVLNSANSTNSVFCMRPALASDIDEYKNNYREKYVTTTLDYLKEASACTASNGNATFSAATLQPILAALISKDEFGFISPIGKGRKTNSYVSHGYSTTGLTHGVAPDAIEYVYALINGSFPDQQNKKILEIGGWKVEIDDEHFNDLMNTWLEHQSVPAQAKSVIFSISNDSASDSFDEKSKALSDISALIVKDLKIERFSDVTKKVFTQAKKEEIVKALRQSIPLGFQGRPMGRINSSFQVFANETRPACAKNKNGATGAYIFTISPQPGVRSDYGSIIFSTFGMGECSKLRRTTTNTYLNGINDLAVDAIKSILENN